MKKIYVLDTSTYLSSFNAVYAFGKNDIVVPFKVLEELDKHKTRSDGVGQQARQTIRFLDELRERGDLTTGVRLKKGFGNLSVVSLGLDFDHHKMNLADMRVPDNQIIACALQTQKLNPTKKVILVSRDIHMRVAGASVGLLAEAYDAESIIKDSTQLFTGFENLVVDDEFIDLFFKGEVILNAEQSSSLAPNTFVMLISSSNKGKTALARYIASDEPLSPVYDNKKDKTFGVTPRNREQTFAMDLLMDDDVPIVTLVGRAGSGKTLLAIAAGLHQVLDALPSDKNAFKKLIVSRPVQPMGKDIGFLPGTLYEKMLPWLAPIQDNLENLLGGKENFAEFLERGTIEIEALTYIRGRSIENAIMIIDEAQNLSAHEIKTIITRVGENTKIIFTGDVEQIDRSDVNDTSNGLTYAVEKLKNTKLAGHITLQKGERSAVASLAAEIL